MRLLQHRIAGPEPCPYLPGLQSTTETLLMTGVSPGELEHLLERGWRRFGPVYFRPVCKGCAECVSVRVPVQSFAPSPNLKRVVRRAAQVRMEVGAPQVDEVVVVGRVRKLLSSRPAKFRLKPPKWFVRKMALRTSELMASP